MLKDQVDVQYGRCAQLLEQTGITTVLPNSRAWGIVGFDGQEYPMPTLHQVQDLVGRNPILPRKLNQGFIRLQLTPLALPIQGLYYKVAEAAIEEQRRGPLVLRLYGFPDRELPLRTRKIPLWNEEIASPPITIDETIIGKDETGELVYFPQSFPNYPDKFESIPHHGKNKSEIIADPNICPIPGWSVGFVEEIIRQYSLQSPGTIGGREQLIQGLPPQEYYDRMQKPMYKGETGWTVEDFLMYFITRVKDTHDIDSSLDMWLNGALIPNKRGLVEGIRGFWPSSLSFVTITTKGPERGHPDIVARSMVRLAA